MKKYLILVCVIALVGGCSSAGGMNIISPSTPENEVKEKVSKLHVTKLEAVSESEMKEHRREPLPQATTEMPPKSSSAGGMNIISPSTPENEVKEKVSKLPVTKLEAVSESEMKANRQEPLPQATAEMPPKTGTAALADRSGVGSIPSIRSGQALEALIILLEKKGTIQREELLQEIRKLEEKDRPQ